MANKGKRSGNGMSPQNDLAKELSSALRWKIITRKKRKKPDEPALRPAPYKPEQILIKKS